jgi:hypothetical protein
MTLVSELIRSRINYVDEERRKDILSERELETEDLDDRSFCGHIHLGAPQCSTSLEQLEKENKSNRCGKRSIAGQVFPCFTNLM